MSLQNEDFGTDTVRHDSMLAVVCQGKFHDCRQIVRRAVNSNGDDTLMHPLALRGLQDGQTPTQLTDELVELLVMTPANRLPRIVLARYEDFV